MFSTLNERFFHGPSSRNKKMIKTAGIKISQSPGLVRSNTVSRSKRNKLFDTGTVSLKSSMNESKWASKTSEFNARTFSKDFAPPVPFQDPYTLSREKRKILSKTSAKFAPSIKQNLKSLIEQRLHQEKMTGQDDNDEFRMETEPARKTDRK